MSNDLTLKLFFLEIVTVVAVKLESNAGSFHMSNQPMVNKYYITLRKALFTAKKYTNVKLTFI